MEHGPTRVRECGSITKLQILKGKKRVGENTYENGFSVGSDIARRGGKRPLFKPFPTIYRNCKQKGRSGLSRLIEKANRLRSCGTLYSLIYKPVRKKYTPVIPWREVSSQADFTSAAVPLRSYDVKNQLPVEHQIYGVAPNACVLCSWYGPTSVLHNGIRLISKDFWRSS